jgi:murein DD-endopeptidase MepM/ murein hydrolase activator NlpD
MKSTFTILAIAIIAVFGLNAQTVNISSKAVFYGESVTVNWSGFSGPVNVILKNGSEFIAHASTNVAGSGQQTLRMTNQDIGTGYQLKVGTDYHVLVELRSNTNIKKESERFSVSIPEVSVQPLSLNYGEKATLRWKGFASNVNLIFTDNGQEIVNAAANVPGTGEQSITLTDEAVNKSGYQITTGNNYLIKVQLRSEPSKTFSSNAFSVQRTFNFNISPVGNLSVNETAGDGQVLLYCNAVWTAYCDQNWIRITSSKTGTGNGVLTYQYDENPNQSPRSAVITVTSATTSRYLTVSQSGKIITINVNPSVLQCESTGGSFSVDVQANTAWTATCSSNWLIIPSVVTGWNNGTIRFVVNQNSSPDSRNTTIEVVAANFSKQIITIYQNGLETIEKAVSFDIEKEGISSILWPYAQGTFQSPENWRITQNEGEPGSWHHSGDYYAQDWGYRNCPDATFYSPFSGIVLFSGYSSGYGNHVVVQSKENPEFAFRVAHLHEINVSAGQIVKAKQKLGKVGSTGNSTGFHAHCVLYKNISKDFSVGKSGVERLKEGNSLGIDQVSSANDFAAKFVFDATYEKTIGGGGNMISHAEYGFNQNGKFFLSPSVIESYQYEKVGVGFWNYSEKKYQESEMVLIDGKYEFESYDNYAGVRDLVYILYTNEGKKYIPHLVYDRLEKKADALSNGMGGYSFHLSPTNLSSNPGEINKMISAEKYGFTGEGLFFIHDNIISSLNASSVKIGYWNYSSQQWMEMPMNRDADYWIFESFDSYYFDYRDYIFIVETIPGKVFLPEAIKQSIIESDLRSNGYGGWNFYTKATFKNSEPGPNKIGNESYGFTAEGEFWISNAVVESIFGVTQVEVGFWSYSQNRWIVVEMIPGENNIYTFQSDDFHSDYRDYIFYLTTPDGKIPVPAHIISQLVNISDVVANETGGHNFRTLPKDKPVDTKSAMVNSIQTSNTEIRKPGQFKIYPNPASSFIQVEIKNVATEAFDYEIYSSTGVMLLKSRLNGNTIELDAIINTGIYILKLYNSKGEIFVSKFMKQQAW